MSTATATTVPTPPKELDGFALRDPIRADFQLLHPDWVCSMAIIRSQYHREWTRSDWVATCTLSAIVGPVKEDDYMTPRVAFTHSWASDDHGLARVHLVSGQKGLDLRLPNGEVGPVEFADRQKLLEFLGQLAGIELHYTADLFGFLKKDGSDTPVLTAQPFPIQSPQA